MKKLKNLGKSLSRNQQKAIRGGFGNCPSIGESCDENTFGNTAQTCINADSLCCSNGTVVSGSNCNGDDGSNGDDVIPIPVGVLRR